MDFGPNSPFWSVLFWIDVITCVTLGVWLAHRLEKEKKQLKDAFRDHYLKQLSWLFLGKLKKRDVDADEVTDHDPNKTSN